MFFDHDSLDPSHIFWKKAGLEASSSGQTYLVLNICIKIRLLEHVERSIWMVVSCLVLFFVQGTLKCCREAR